MDAIALIIGFFIGCCTCGVVVFVDGRMKRHLERRISEALDQHFDEVGEHGCDSADK